MKKLVALLMAFTLLFSFSAVAEEKTLEQLLSAPEWKGPTEPAKAPVGPDFKLAIVNSGWVSPVASKLATEVGNIAEEMGWSYKIFDGNNNSADQIQAFSDAVSMQADYIISCSINVDGIQQGLQIAQDAGIPVGSLNAGTGSPNNRAIPEGMINFKWDSSPYYYELGSLLGDWYHEQGATSVLCFGYNMFATCMATQQGMLDKFEEYGIEVYGDEIHYFVNTMVGDELNRMVLGFVQADPSIEYIAMPADKPANTTAEYLSSIGYDYLKLTGAGGLSETMANIRAGVTAASVSYDMVQNAYAGIDTMIRDINGQAWFEPLGQNLAQAVITIDNPELPKEEGAFYSSSFDFQSIYKKLWGV